MFRLSDYDFENGTRDYVAFMSVFKKFLELVHELNSEETPYECVMIDRAENLALSYVQELRGMQFVSEELKAFIYECCNELEYPVIMLDDKTVDEIDDLLWDIYGDMVG